jgi:hypothetical protein
MHELSTHQCYRAATRGSGVTDVRPKEAEGKIVIVRQGSFAPPPPDPDRQGGNR